MRIMTDPKPLGESRQRTTIRQRSQKLAIPINVLHPVFRVANQLQSERRRLVLLQTAVLLCRPCVERFVRHPAHLAPPASVVVDTRGKTCILHCTYKVPYGASAKSLPSVASCSMVNCGLSEYTLPRLSVVDDNEVSSMSLRDA